VGARNPGLVKFEEGYFERIWGGRKLRTLYGKDLPDDRLVGEAWLLADHPTHESVVAAGPHKGRSLHDLATEDPEGILGTHARLTVHGRFPLLLKLLDATDILSVQVHPDDECARRLGEPDVGKTEMWHVLQADPGSELICGLNRAVTPATFGDAIRDHSVVGLLNRFEVREGTSVLVPSGTVHAIGAGIVLAEIQQNSDLTYRLYDWSRVDADGKGRTLHIDKAIEAIHFDASRSGPALPLGYQIDDAECQVLSACRHFAAERVKVNGHFRRVTQGRSFHILLVVEGELRFLS
jgi:mannose-6-phosphate isomerase